MRIQALLRHVHALSLSTQSIPTSTRLMAGRLMSTRVREVGEKHTPYGDIGSGHYSDATKGCYDVFDKMSRLVMDSVEHALASRGVSGVATNIPFRIADFGAADAGTSMPLLLEVIKAVHAREPGVAVEVIYEDQPGNDWSSVFKRTQGAIPSDRVAAGVGLTNLENVFVFASGTSFYSQCMPSASVDVAFCSTAMHWLTSCPALIPDALHSACTNDPATQAAFAEQAALDWKRILAARAAELRQGGSMVIANFAKDDQGQFLGTTARTSSMHDNFAKVWAKLVTPEEFDATNFPNQYRSLEACSEPFGGVGGSFEGMKLVDAHTAVVPCPFLDTYLANPNSQSPQEFAETFVPTTRTWSNSTFASGLSSTRPAQEKEALLNQFWGDYIDLVAADPSRHGMDYVHSYLTLQKE